MNHFKEEKIEQITIKRYVKCDTEALEQYVQTNLSTLSIAIYNILSLKLLIHSNIAEVSISEIVRYSNSSKMTVIRCLKELESKGFIATNKVKGRQTFYQLSFSFNGKIENQNESKPVSHRYHTGTSQVPVSTLYINKRTKKRKTTSLQKKEDDVFFRNENVQKNPPTQKIVYDPEKLDVCKRYLANLKALKLIEIKTTEAQYLASIYRNNEEVDTWENLKEKTKSMETQLTEKKNPVCFVEVPKNQEDLKHDLKNTNEIDIDTLKKRESYEDEYQAILKELQEENPMIKPMIKPGAFVDRLVHAKMHENLLVGEGRR